MELLVAGTQVMVLACMTSDHLRPLFRSQKRSLPAVRTPEASPFASYTLNSKP